jgi:hypothetical protein
MTEKFCLKWNDFQENISTAFGSLREDRDFSDVTLACEDGQQVEAHRVILAASSPFFQNLLRRNKNSHPLVYMRGMRSEDLVAIVDFMYLGETNIYQESLDGFLAIAEELNLKGLTGSNNDSKEGVATTKAPDPKLISPRETKFTNNMSTKHKTAKETTKLQNYEEGTVAVPNQTMYGETQELDEQIQTMISRGQNLMSNGNRAYICQVCGKEGQVSNIKDHIEANHIDGISLPCNTCGKIFRSRNALRQHNDKNHKQIISSILGREML